MKGIKADCNHLIEHTVRNVEHCAPTLASGLLIRICLQPYFNDNTVFLKCKKKIRSGMALFSDNSSFVGFENCGRRIHADGLIPPTLLESGSSFKYLYLNRQSLFC